jgi:hypothetical protein
VAVAVVEDDTVADNCEVLPEHIDVLGLELIVGNGFTVTVVLAQPTLQSELL